MITTIAPRFASFRAACDYLATNGFREANPSGRHATGFVWEGVSGDVIIIRWNSDEGKWTLTTDYNPF